MHFLGSMVLREWERNGHVKVKCQKSLIEMFAGKAVKMAEKNEDPELVSSLKHS